MNKLLLGLATCALILSSCNKNEVIDAIDKKDAQLSFNLALGKQSRVTEVDNAALKNPVTGATETNPIALYAYHDLNGAWKAWYSDGLYWNATPQTWDLVSADIYFRNMNESKYISYFPQTNVTPDANSFANADFVTTFPSFNYTILDVAAQEDLIAGLSEVDVNKTDIAIGMRHILSQVNFGVKAYRGVNIEITNIIVNEVFNFGTYKFGSRNSYPIGEWDVSTATTASYIYDMKGGVVPNTAVTDNKYIFGDGGKFAPGKGTDTFYPTGNANAWQRGNAVSAGVTLNNSLMLMPQDFTTNNAHVSFHYKITDKNGGVIADTDGLFFLDFAASDVAYTREWKQNMRYLYLIDFKNFLEDNKLSFTVDVDMTPWENYNNDNGNVDVEMVSIPTNNQLKTLTDGQTWYLATRSTTPPTATDKYVHLMNEEIWDWSTYTFDGIGTVGESITIGTDNVLTDISITTQIAMPPGFDIERDITGNFVITNIGSFSNATLLKAAVESCATDDFRFGFLGDATAIDVTSYNMTGLTTSGESLKITFRNNRPSAALIDKIILDPNWSWSESRNRATWTRP